MRTIKVTGKGRLSVKPDTIRLLITDTGSDKDYEKTVKASAAATEELKDLIEKLGFKRSELKTLNFNIDTEYESYTDKNGNWKQRFKGYRYAHATKLEFPADNAVLGRLLTAISKCSSRPEFRIQYTVKDAEACKNELLAKAVEDSAAKAKVLAKAAGVKLGEIETIDYSVSEITFVAEPMGRLMKFNAMEEASDTAINIDIEADDIKVDDSVTVVWSIV